LVRQRLYNSDEQTNLLFFKEEKECNLKDRGKAMIGTLSGPNYLRS
jgi:hypothetical protein